MKKIKNLGMAIAIILPVLGCSNLKRSLQPEELAKIQKVAVISGLGDEMHHTFIGATVFSNSDKLIKVSNWKMDELAEKEMIEDLKKNSSFKKVDRISGKFVKGNLINKEERSPLLKMAKAQGYDILIALMPSSYDNAPLFKPGYGLYRYADQDSPNKFGYMMAVVDIYDTTTEEQMAWQWTFNPWNLDPGIVDTAVLHWKDAYDDYSALEKADIQKALKHRFEQGIDYSLKALKLY